MSDDGEPLGEAGMAVLRTERAARKAAEREAREYKRKYREARDAAELWQGRARRNHHNLNVERARNAAARQSPEGQNR